MHDSNLDAASGPLDLPLDLSISHLWEDFSDSLDGLFNGDLIAPCCSLENVALILGGSSAMIDITHSKLDAREPVANSVEGRHHPVLRRLLLPSPISFTSLSYLRLRILTKRNPKYDPSCFLCSSFSFSLLLSLPLLSPPSSRA